MTARIRWREMVHRGIAAAVPRRNLLMYGPPGCGSVSLTFDDGPHPEHTPRLLDALALHRIPATFFVVGRLARQHPTIVRRIVSEGHALGNHTFSHPVPERISTRQLLDEVRHTSVVLADILGRETSLFRPPYGRLSAPKLWSLWRAGQTVVLWNADPKDYAHRTSADVRHWFRSRPLRGGDLVLLHDAVAFAQEIVPDLAISARERELTFATIDAWVDESGDKT